MAGASAAWRSRCRPAPPAGRAVQRAIRSTSAGSRRGCARPRAAGRRPVGGRRRGQPGARRRLLRDDDRGVAAAAQYRCASCSQVKPIPPWTWMFRLAFRGRGDRHRGGDRGGEENWSPPPPRRGRRPSRGGGELGGDEHVGAVVLDRLEGGDHPAELLADLRTRPPSRRPAAIPTASAAKTARATSSSSLREPARRKVSAAAPSSVSFTERRQGSRFDGNGMIPRRRGGSRP